MYKFTSGLAVIAATAQASKRNTLTADGRKVRGDHHKQNVGLGVNDDICIFKNFQDYWCFTQDNNTPVATIGLEWEQIYDKTNRNEDPILDFFQLEMIGYAEIQLYLEMTMYIEKFIDLTLIFDMEKFKYELIMSFIVNSAWQACFGLGYESDRIYGKWTFELAFYSCIKSIIDNVFDWSGNWTGNDAVVLEDCGFNNKEPADIWVAELLEDTQEPTTWIGTFDPKSTKCTTALAAGHETPVHIRRFAQMGYKTLGSYFMGENSPFAHLEIE